MARTPEVEKRPGLISQIKMIFTFTKDVYRWMPWLMIGILLAGVGLGVLVGFLIPPAQIWSIILWGVSGLLFGVLGALMTLTRLMRSATYVKLDGRPGAAGHALSIGLPRSWSTSDEPVQINGRTQEAIYRAVGNAGIVLIGEGTPHGLKALMKKEESKAKRIAHGVPVHVIYVGNGEGQVTLKELPKAIKALPKGIDKATRVAVVQRLSSMRGGIADMPIPKGIDPTRVRAPRPR